jgi:hypothetical protein
MPEYYDEIENELYEYDESDDELNHDHLSSEDWQDWNSTELLNMWMSIVEYHEVWYLPLFKTFNDFCEFVYEAVPISSVEVTPPPPEVQAIYSHPWIKNLDWNRFFL